MKWLTAILLTAVAVRHNSAFWLAATLNTSPAAVSYVMGGALEAVLGLILAWLLLTFAASVWRNLALVGALMLVVEGSQMAACRLAIADIRSLPANTTLCDYVTGVPIGTVITTLYLLIIGYVVWRR